MSGLRVSNTLNGLISSESLHIRDACLRRKMYAQNVRESSTPRNLLQREKVESFHFRSGGWTTGFIASVS